MFLTLSPTIFCDNCDASIRLKIKTEIMDIPATASIKPMPFLKFFSLDIGDAGGLDAYNFIFIVIRLKPHPQRTVIACLARQFLKDNVRPSAV